MQFKNKQWTTVLLVIVVALVLGALILNTEKSNNDHSEHSHEDTESVEAVDNRPKHGEAGHDHAKDHLPLPADAHEQQHESQAKEFVKGPHGGKLFTQDGYGVEVTIFEQNVPPEFRVYTYQDGSPLDPAVSSVQIQLARLGAETQTFNFSKQQDYLRGDAVVVEPHSFEVNITAKHNNKTYHFNYDQVEARVTLSEKQLKLNSIEVLTAGPAKINTTLHLQGEVKLNADKRVYIVPRVGGIVETVSVNAGDKVRKGQVLASISSQSIADIRSELLAAQQQAELARATYKREKQLWEEKISAEQDYLQARNALQQAEINTKRIQQKLSSLGAGSSAKGAARYEVRSPIDGVVTHKNISQGKVVTELESVYEVADLTSVWVEMNVYAKDIHAVKTGQKVTIKASASDEKAQGTISYVSALVGTESRTAMARVVLNNSQGSWLPGLPVNIDLIADEVEVPLAVSIEGIQTIRDWTVVFGRYGQYFEARPVVLGRCDDRYAEVLQGFKAGDKYAAGNSFLIKADIGKAGATHDH